MMLENQKEKAECTFVEQRLNCKQFAAVKIVLLFSLFRNRFEARLLMFLFVGDQKTQRSLTRVTTKVPNDKYNIYPAVVAWR